MIFIEWIFTFSNAKCLENVASKRITFSVFHVRTAYANISIYKYILRSVKSMLCNEHKGVCNTCKLLLHDFPLFLVKPFFHNVKKSKLIEIKNLNFSKSFVCILFQLFDQKTFQKHLFFHYEASDKNFLIKYCMFNYVQGRFFSKND